MDNFLPDIQNILGAPTSPNLAVTFTDEATGQKIWTTAVILESIPMSSSDNTEQPFDGSGNSVNTSNPDLAAAKIILPTRYRVVLLAVDLATVESIMTNWEDTTTTFSVSSRGTITDSMCMTTVEIEHVADMLSATKVTIEFEQVVVAKAAQYSPEEASDQDTYGMGQQAPASKTIASGVGDLYNSLKSGLGL